MRSSKIFACFIIVAVTSITGCAFQSNTVAEQQKTPSYAITSDPHGVFNQAIGSGLKHNAGNSGFHLLPKGQDALVARFEIIQSAAHTVDLQYFSSNNDKSGNLLLYSLLQAADRGVRIRILIDGWDLDDFDFAATALSHNPHIEIRVFNPLATPSVSLFAKTSGMFMHYDQFDRRMHNKAVIADNEVAVMGGRNLGDEYFSASSQFNFRDLDVLATGPVVLKISANFDRFWNSPQACPFELLSDIGAKPEERAKARQKLQSQWEANAPEMLAPVLKGPSLPAQLKSGDFALIWAPAEFSADKPDKVDTPSSEATSKPEAKVLRMGNTAQKEFIITSPYFVPLDEGTDWLIALAKKGVKVSVLTNSLASTDMVMAHAGYSNYRQKLIENGIDLYELKAIAGHRPQHMFKGSSSQSSLHAKNYIIDRKDLIIGSFNFDPRSISYNTEQVLTIHNSQIAGQAYEIFEHGTAPEVSYHVVMKVRKPEPTIAATQHGSVALQPATPQMEWVTEENGVVQHYMSEPQAGFRRSVTSGFISLLPIDEHL